MPRPRILVVDDEKNTRVGLSSILREDGYLVQTAADGHQALDEVARTRPDLIVVDLKLPKMDGMEVLRRVKKNDPDVSVVMVTAYGTIKTAVQAMKEGADDYLTKPIDVEELELVIERSLERRQLLVETRDLKERLREKYKFESIVGNSPEMQSVFKTIEQVAPSRASILILGESGTGKELVANAIHYSSPRRDSPFIKVSCASLSETILESELFGHEKGAFTDAISRRKGRFEMADGGTLFLDEVGEIPLSTQVKLLRFLQEREFERVGGNETIRVDVRLIAASNRDLEEAIAAGTFRQDLYYRLNVVAIEMPPLRRRRSDISLLVSHFMRKHALENNKAIDGISPEALSRLISYDWPGNVRELENVIERAVVLCGEETIGLKHLPPIMQPETLGYPSPTVIPGASMEDVERDAILKTLEYTGGNRTKAAEILNVSVRKIQYKLKEYQNQGIPLPDGIAEL